MTFNALGETVATSEDLDSVNAGLEALVSGNGMPRQALWRRRVFFEGANALGGADRAAARLLAMHYVPELVGLAMRTAAGDDVALDLTDIVKGLNFLVCGFPSPDEGLIVPDQAARPRRGRRAARRRFHRGRPGRRRPGGDAPPAPPPSALRGDTPSGGVPRPRRAGDSGDVGRARVLWRA
jgi:hypothetical protein